MSRSWIFVVASLAYHRKSLKFWLYLWCFIYILSLHTEGLRLCFHCRIYFTDKRIWTYLKLSVRFNHALTRSSDNIFTILNFQRVEISHIIWTSKSCRCPCIRCWERAQFNACSRRARPVDRENSGYFFWLRVYLRPEAPRWLG